MEWNWIEDNYPESVQVLDFYHGYEKICAWIVKTFQDKTQQKQWCDLAKELMLNDQTAELIEQIALIEAPPTSKKSQKTLLAYLQKHIHRMQYATFRQQGYLIGSGAIESAQRTVVQQRLKKSGQRWTNSGAQQVLNLRTRWLSNQWGDVTNLIRSNAA